MRESIIGLLLLAICVLLLEAGFIVGRERGQINVASGQVACGRIDNGRDTKWEWECE